jgi:hypothetical protein
MKTQSNAASPMVIALVAGVLFASADRLPSHAATQQQAKTSGSSGVEAIPAPCHPNPRAASDMATLRTRGDIKSLPKPLQDRLVRLAGRPHTALPIQAYAEADQPSQLFQYYLLDTSGFEPNVFTSIIPGVNETAMLTATGAVCGIPSVGAVRLVVEPKPGLPTDPNDVRAFIDIFTDIDPLFVINNESGWYEGWMIHDLTVAPVGPARPDGKAQFGMLLASDAAAIAKMGSGNNVAGRTFTTDGSAVRFPSESDHFPDVQSNVLPIQLSMGAYNAMQQSDVHAYWEFNYTTNWIHPLYELPFTGGIPGTFEAGQIGALQSIIPGSGPAGVVNSAVSDGDNPDLPRDPDKFDADIDAQREFRQRFIPSAAEVARVDQNGDGIVSALEGDVDSASDGFADNTRLFLPATAFLRFAVTREINDGLLAPRFAPSQRAWLLAGRATTVTPVVPASAGRDGDDR